LRHTHRHAMRHLVTHLSTYRLIGTRDSREIRIPVYAHEEQSSPYLYYKESDEVVSIFPQEFCLF